MSELSSKYDKLVVKYNNLREQMANLIGNKENLIKHKFFNLKTDYIIKIGYLEHELYSLDIEIGRLMRKIEIAEQSIKNSTSIYVQFIELEVVKEFEEILQYLTLKDNEIKIASYLSTLEKPTDEEYIEINKYFNLVIYLLNPDINPNLTELQQKLWIKGCIAYENTDIKYLKIINKLAKDEMIEIKRYEATISEEILKSRIEQLENKIILEMDEIKTIQNNFPFNKEELLKSNIKIKEIQNDLKNNIKEGKIILRLLEEQFLMMLVETKYLN